jgi:hypothetical protein
MTPFGYGTVPRFGLHFVGPLVLKLKIRVVNSDPGTWSGGSGSRCCTILSRYDIGKKIKKTLFSMFFFNNFHILNFYQERTTRIFTV